MRNINQNEIARINRQLSTARSLVRDDVRDALAACAMSDDTRDALADLRRMNGGK